MKADILTIFPEFFRGPLDHGIMRRAQLAGLVEYRIRDLREFTHDRHRTVDDRPFGGGEGMVLKPEPICECLESLGIAPRDQRTYVEADIDAEAAGTGGKAAVILLSAQGQRFQQIVAEELAQFDRLVLICGRYEGIDERVAEYWADRELSIGDYVLSGGELAAAVVLDAVTRLIPGALGNEASSRQESFSSSVSAEVQQREYGDAPDSTCASGGLLDYPHYTRPAEFRGLAVPEVLMSGNHDEIRRWRRQKALEKTLRNRPDLLDGVALSEEDRAHLAQAKLSQQN